MWYFLEWRLAKNHQNIHTFVNYVKRGWPLEFPVQKKSLPRNRRTFVLGVVNFWPMLWTRRAMSWELLHASAVTEDRPVSKEWVHLRILHKTCSNPPILLIKVIIFIFCSPREFESFKLSSYFMKSLFSDEWFLERFAPIIFLFFILFILDFLVSPLLIV